ncbi:hypothetical protein THRCLA_02879 [Thraustotheca clavata]|uniref:FYVE-type domain-containing protein n=1 Tax=Thraustotheca clavata TaxID=74557 RepID=A0A1W0A403_9STRA|nr:hypothetical protein THRCLA_02879 [Thraustotheca clavata]
MARQSISVHELLPKSKWAPAPDCYACMACTKSFTMFRTRQHCHVCGDVVCNACAVDTPVQNEHYQATVCLRCTTKRESSRVNEKPKPVLRVDTIFNGTLFDPNDLLETKKDPQTIDPVRQKKTQANLSKFELQVLPKVDITTDASATASTRGVVPFDELVNLEDFASSLSRMRCYRCRRMMILHARHSCSACGEVFCRSCVTGEVTQPPGRRWLQNIDICLTCTTIKNNFGSYRECRWVHKSLTPTALPPGIQATIRCPLYVNRQEFSRKIAELKYIEEVQLIPWNQLPHRIKLFLMEGSKCGECDVKLTRSTRSRCNMCDSTFCVACTVQKFARLPTKFELEEVRVCVTCIAAFRRWNGTRCKELWKTCAEVYARASGTLVDSNIAPPPSSPIGWIRNRASLEFKSYDSDILNSNPRSSGPFDPIEVPAPKPKGTKLSTEEEELLRTIERHLSVTEGIAKAIEGIDSRRSLHERRRNSMPCE